MTIRQKQLLLAYLGYYPGQIDGIWGEQSEKATRAFQRAHMQTEDGIFGEETETAICQVIGSGKGRAQAGNIWEEIRHFSRQEFSCRCGKCGGFPAEPEEKLLRTAQRLRAYFGSAVHVSSGVRCKAHNARVGGVSNSRHLSGKAMDFRVSGHSAADVLAYVLQQPEIRYAYAIDGSFVHMDVE